MNFHKRKYITSDSLSQIAWKRFLKNKLSLSALVIVSIFIIMAMLGYLITPDSSPFSNEQYLELSTKKPGFKIKMLQIRKNEQDCRGLVYPNRTPLEISKSSP